MHEPLSILETQLHDASQLWQREKQEYADDRESWLTREADLERQLKEAGEANANLASQLAASAKKLEESTREVEALRASLGVSKGETQDLRKQVAEHVRKENVLNSQATVVYSQLYKAQATTETLERDLVQARHFNKVLEERFRDSEEARRKVEAQMLQEAAAAEAQLAEERSSFEAKLAEELEKAEARLAEELANAKAEERARAEAELGDHSAAHEARLAEERGRHEARLEEEAARAKASLAAEEAKLRAAEAKRMEMWKNLSAATERCHHAEAEVKHAAALAKSQAAALQAKAALADARAVAVEKMAWELASKAEHAESNLKTAEAQIAHLEAEKVSAAAAMQAQPLSPTGSHHAPASGIGVTAMTSEASSGSAAEPRDSVFSEEERALDQLLSTCRVAIPSLAFAKSLPHGSMADDVQDLLPVQLELDTEAGELSWVRLGPIEAVQTLLLSKLKDISQPAVIPATLVDVDIAEGKPGVRFMLADEQQAGAFLAALTSQYRVAPGSMLDLDDSK